MKQENQLIREMAAGRNTAYILEDPSILQKTEFRVMQAQKNDSLINCMQISFNGKIELFYLTEDYKELSHVLEDIDESAVLQIIYNLLGSVVDIAENGFLKLSHVVSDFDHIFVDPNTYKVSLLYLPTSVSPVGTSDYFESELRANLVRLLNSLNEQQGLVKLSKLKTDLSNGTMTLAEVRRKLVLSVREPSPQRNLRLVCLDPGIKRELIVKGQVYRIGKNRDSVEGLVSFNNSISRTHCQITQKDHRYFVEDLNSANGTFVNGEKLKPGRQKELKNGDTLRLANSDFRVILE